MNGPRRLLTQRQYTGPAATIGAPPVGYEAGTGKVGQTYGPKGPSGRSADYEAKLAAKRAMDRATVARKPQRPRSAGPMGPRTTRGDVVRDWAGGAAGGGGAGAGTAFGTVAGPWWQNPWLWGAAIALYWFTRKGKK